MYTQIPRMTNLDQVTSTKGVQYIHIYMHSLKSKYASFCTEFTNKDIEVITMSETWFKPCDEDDNYQLNSYNMYRLDRVVKNRKNKLKTGGGVCTYIKQNIPHDDFVLSFLNISNHHIEVQHILITKPNTKPTVLINVYRPPDGNPDLFIALLSACIANIPELVKHVIVLLGDMNLDVSKHNDKAIALVNNLKQYALRQLITEFTRFSENKHGVIKKTTLDLIFTNIEHVSQSGVINIHLSDHIPVYVVKKTQM